MLLIVTLSVFITVVLLTTIMLYPVFSRNSVIQERLAKLADEKENASLMPEKKFWKELLSRLGKKMPVGPKDQSKYTRLIVAAGFRKENVTVFLGTKIILACAFPAGYVFFCTLLKGGSTGKGSTLFALALAIIGFLLPGIVLTRMVEKRKREIFHTLPDFLDLLTVCVEAGLGIDAAFIRVSECPQFKKNPLIAEIKTAVMETRAGKPRAEALKDMAERTMVEDISSFVAMLVQAEKFGTSLGKALRIHSDYMRIKRKLSAEEAAAKTAIKMLLPLAFCIFPALLVVMLGPAFIKIMGLFKHL